MQQLLKITSTPIEIRYKIEPSRLEFKQADNARSEVTQSRAKINMESKNIEVRLDTMDMRRSLGFRTSMDRAKEGAQLGQENLQQYCSSKNQFAKQVSHIENGVTIGQVVRQKMMEQPESYTAFLPSTGPNISWLPNQLNKNYQAGELSFDWQTARNVLEYVPGHFHMEVLQYPKVQIEYLGEPNYVPKSADPNYAGE